ncbi:MAG: hypothetical protein F7C09_07405 [Aeropyrum sp.]|nr:hypothetical protein [Aeropyrum sp.]
MLGIVIERITRVHSIKCNKYIIGTVYIRPDKILTRFVRDLKSLGGILHFVDEAERKLVFKIGLKEFLAFSEKIKEYQAASSFEVKASCPAKTVPTEALKDLEACYLQKSPKADVVVAYCIIEGRIVEVELKNKRLILKLGKPHSSKIRGVPPQGAFRHSLAEALELVKDG